MRKLSIALCVIALAISSFASIQYADRNADMPGSVLGTYNIGSTNDQFSLKIDGGSTQTFTLTHGAARTATQVCADLAGLTGATCSVSRGYVRIRTNSATVGTSSIQILAPTNNANSTLGFTAQTTYCAWSTVSTCKAQQLTTIDGSSKASIIAGIEAVLADGSTPAGWKVVSGGGTTNLLLQSGWTPPGQDLAINARFKDNSGTMVEVSLENIQGTHAGGSSTTDGGMLAPGAGKVYNVWADKYCLDIYTSVPTAVHEFVEVCTLILPSFLQGVITDAGWMMGNASSESSGTVRTSFRACTTTYGTCITGIGSVGADTNQQLLYNGTLWEEFNTNNGQGAGDISLVYPLAPTGSFFESGYLFADNSALVADALIAYSKTSWAGFGYIMGYRPDSFITTDATPGDTQRCNSDTYTVVALTDNNGGNGGNVNRGTLWNVVAGPGSCTP